MSFVAEFKEFALKGSLIDMAVGIVIGAAISDSVSALVDHVLMPLIGVLLGGVDFSGLAFTVGEAKIGYGAFIQALINFFIIALVLFVILKSVNRMRATVDESESSVDNDAEVPDDVALLSEIRDLLKRGAA